MARAEKKKRKGSVDEGKEGVQKRRKLAYVNKQRLLLVASRGISARQRHLLDDIGKLLPHHKRESKLDAKGDPRALNEISELKSCNGVLYFEARKHADLYCWLGRPQDGPSFKFQVLNIHTMDELRLTGNCALGTRPLLSFDATFDSAPHWRLAKALLSLTFGTPRGHPKSKPFFDHAISFAILDRKIWVRHYQISIDDDAVEESDRTKLIEIGPRFVLAPIRALAGSFRGATIYNDPNAYDRFSQSLSPSSKYQDRKQSKAMRQEHKNALLFTSASSS